MAIEEWDSSWGLYGHWRNAKGRWISCGTAVAQDLAWRSGTVPMDSKKALVVPHYKKQYLMQKLPWH